MTVHVLTYFAVLGALALASVGVIHLVASWLETHQPPKPKAGSVQLVRSLRDEPARLDGEER